MRRGGQVGKVVLKIAGRWTAQSLRQGDDAMGELLQTHREMLPASKSQGHCLFLISGRFSHVGSTLEHVHACTVGGRVNQAVACGIALGAPRVRRS